jgi:putative ABC transport system permease protein
MTLYDLMEVSLRNLRRIKLRAALTTAGIIIAIATFTAMLSFAEGNHRYFTTAYNEFGLMNQMSVTPGRANAADTTDTPILDGQAIGEISKIPGVRLAYPYSSFDVRASVLDTTVTTTARALPADAVRTRLFSRILGGAEFSSESADEVIVTQEFVEMVDVHQDSLVGRPIVISMKAAVLDSALVAAVGDPRLEVEALLETVDRDSIDFMGYRERFIRREMSARIGRFIEGLMTRQADVSDTLTIAGVAPDDPSYRMRVSPIIIPEQTARRLSSGGLVMTGDPLDLLEALKNGALFEPAGAFDSRSYPRVTLELDPLANHTAVKDSIEALGYRAFSFAEQFKEMQRFMVYYYVGLGVIGVIALVTAALGIINTLVMSITERRREIGILKSLGANEGDIRKLYLVESGVMGAVGSVVGIAFGWAGTRVVAVIMRHFMEREDMPIFDPFALPPWLIALGFSFGLLVSLLAGLYPAARAARVDPVQALRAE